MINSESAAFLSLSLFPSLFVSLPALFPSALINTWGTSDSFNEDRVDGSPATVPLGTKSSIIINSAASPFKRPGAGSQTLCSACPSQIPPKSLYYASSFFICPPWKPFKSVCKESVMKLLPCLLPKHISYIPLHVSCPSKRAVIYPFGCPR